MNDHIMIVTAACVLASLISCNYIAYVMITHGDGVVFGTVMVTLGGLLGVVTKAFYDHTKARRATLKNDEEE